MPGTEYTERIGKFNNKMNRGKFSQQKEQELLNRIANSIGQTLTEEGLRSPIGWLYFLSIVQNLQMPPEGALENVVQKTDAGVELNTTIKKKNEGEKARITSFRSSPTVNNVRVDPPTPLNRIEKSVTEQEFNSSSEFPNHVSSLTEEFQGLCLKLHKLASGIEKLSNYTTEKETFLAGRTKTTHFKTICQNATAISNQIKKQGSTQSKENNYFSFGSSSKENKGTSDFLSSEEAVQMLRNNFQAFFEKEHEQSNHTNDNGTTQRAFFWENLNETISSFFIQFEQTTDTEPQAGVSGGAIMDGFLSMTKRTLSSIDYENQVSYDQRTNHLQTTQPTKITLSGSKSEPSTSKQKEPALKEEEIDFLTKLSYITSELATTMDGFIDRLFSPFLGAEAKSLSEPSAPTEATSIDEQADRTVSPTIDPETNQVHEINESIVKKQLPATRYQEPLPIFFYDKDLFQRRNGTSNVNKKLKEFFIKEKMANDTTPNLELLDIAQKWIGNKELDKLERKQFLTYLILQHYGVENVRWGEFVSASNSQNLFLQWQANTLLEDYTYKEITDETVQHDLSESESVLVTSFNQYKKESDQLYVAFINDLPESIPKNHPLSPIYYDEALFKAREKTIAVNEAVLQFLNEQNVSKDIHLPNELVRTLQEWILAGENYDHILQRQCQAAELLCKEYGAIREELSPIQARLLLLQWENNNMQAGYHFKEFNGHERTEQNQYSTDEFVEKSEIPQKIADFIRENEIEVPQPNKKLLPVLDEEQKESQRIKIASLLTKNGMPYVSHDPNQLVQAVTQWLFLGIDDSESASSVALDGTASGSSKSPEIEASTSEELCAFKIKQLANVLLENKEEGLSEERANELVGQWLTDTLEEVPPQKLRAKKRSIPSEVTSVWQSPNLMSKIEQFLREQSLLPSGSVTKEIVLLAAGKWLMPEENKTVFHKDNLQSFAQVIAKNLNFYGRKGEKLSDPVAEMMVRKWVFENILKGSLEEYLAKQIVEAPAPSAFTVSQLESKLNGALNDFYREIPLDKFRDQVKDQLHHFMLLWNNFVQSSLPVDLHSLDEQELISHSGLLPQLVGEKLSEFTGAHKGMNNSQKRSLGVAFMDSIAENKEPSLVELQAIFLPALLAAAQLEPDSLREAFAKGNYKEVALNTFINYCQAGYFKIVEEQKTIDTLFQPYQNALLNWRRKRAIAEEVIQACYAADATLEKEDSLHPLGKRPFEEVTREEAIDYYLSGRNPCPTLKRPLLDLEKKYKELTNKVASAYWSLDIKLMEIALNAMDPIEFQFLFSPETQIYEASANIKKASSTMRGFPMWRNAPLKDTELFMAERGGEERVYALKKLGREQGYAVYRVDEDPELYNKHELFTKKYIRSLDRFEFSVTKNSERFGGIHGQAHSAQTLFTWRLGWTHRNKLYDQLYKEGDEKTRREKGHDFLLSFVPFYDCVTGSIEQDASKAAVACTIDTLLLLPILGEAVALSTKFGLGAASAFLRGGLKNVLRSSGHLVPKAADLAKLGVNVLRYFDPGIELVNDTSKLLAKLAKLNFKSQTKEVDNLIIMIKKLQKEAAVASEPLLKARLPKGGPDVLVKRVDDQLYVRVTNPKTGDAFGEYYLLKNNQLEVFEGPVKFSEKQEEMIRTAAVKIEDNQQFVDEKNVNPMAYGEAPVRTIIEENKPNQQLIKMDDQWVPVKVTPIPGHGVRYDAIISEKLIPVNYNGREWYFEAETSPFLAGEIRNRIGEKMNKFETLTDPSVLSAPDEKGLMRDASGRSYIKIKNNYVPLILLDEEVGRYHLVKKNFNSPMTVLRFKSNRGQFQFETTLEKNEWQNELMNREERRITSKIQPSKDEIEIQHSAVGSQEGPSQSGPSQSGPSQSGPSQSGPSQSGPSQSGPSQSGSSQSGPSQSGPSQSGPSQSGPSQSGSSQSGPSQSGSSQSGPSQSGSSQSGPSQPGPSQSGSSQSGPSQTGVDQRASKLLPPSTDRSLTWQRIRGGSVYTGQVFRKAVDLTVQPQRIHTFIPARSVELYPDEQILRRTYFLRIDDYLKRHPEKDFQVFVGLDTRQSPDFIKPFQVEMARSIETARDAFSRMKGICQDLSAKDTLSNTYFDRYVTKMFKLESITNKRYKESILREINTRLLSVAEKGEQILQQTVDFGFENIWIVSKKLVWDDASKTYLSQQTKISKNGVTSAFIIPGDPQCRIVVLADAFHLNPSLKPKVELKTPASTIIIHETTHLGSRTADFVSLTSSPKGFAQSGEDICDNYFKKLGEVVNSRGFTNFVDRLAQQQNLPGLSEKAVSSALNSDTMLRVNLQMEDAEMVTTIIRDLSEGRDFHERPRIERSVEDKRIDNQQGWLFFNFAIGVLFNAEQYWLSPHLNKTHEVKKAEVPQELDVTMRADEESTHVKSEKKHVEKRSIENILKRTKEKNHVRIEKMLNQRTATEHSML